MRKLVAGNWKMNGLKADGLTLAGGLVERASAERIACDLLVCPPAVLLMVIGDTLRGSGFALGGQDCHAQQAGAHTGDVSAAMLKDAGCSHVILGHSERRTDHHETDALIRTKVEAARSAGLIVLVCVGETAQERDAGGALEVVARQLAGSLPEGLSALELVIAYEPIWAIGSGCIPRAADIAAVHRHIRAVLHCQVADAAAVRILYGGSVKPGNTRELLAIEDVNGALVGGASLNADDFWAIARQA